MRRDPSRASYTRDSVRWRATKIPARARLRQACWRSWRHSGTLPLSRLECRCVRLGDGAVVAWSVSWQCRGRGGRHRVNGSDRGRLQRVKGGWRSGRSASG
eukprot:ctg_2259.g659